MLLELTADMLTIIGGLVVAYIIYLLFIKEENGKYLSIFNLFSTMDKKKRMKSDISKPLFFFYTLTPSIYLQFEKRSFRKKVMSSPSFFF